VSPFETTVGVRYRDLDTMGHVNNAVYATYMETARTEFFREVLDIDVAAVGGVVVASLSLEFHAPLTGTGPVTVSLWVPEMGETSCTFAYEIRRDDRRVADGETTLVTLDDAGEPTPLPESVRTAIGEYREPPES
jgi:acyl-CoA thioester hydrolase